MNIIWSLAKSGAMNAERRRLWVADINLAD
jgi:hypothetical protein